MNQKSNRSCDFAQDDEEEELQPPERRQQGVETPCCPYQGE